MTKALRTLGALLLGVVLAGGVCFAQTAPGLQPFGLSYGAQHRVGTVYYAPVYATWQGFIISGNSATGSASIIVAPAGSAGGIGTLGLQDGYQLPLTDVFNTNVPIYIMDANAETVTPTAVSIGNCPVGTIGIGQVVQCATITATFGNTHGGSAVVVSGDTGIEEAITDAGLTGGGDVYWSVDTGVVTLSTGGLTTTTTTKIPTTYYSGGASGRVTTTITTSANWEIGITGTLAGFCAQNSTLTAGTTCTQVAPALVGTGSTALTAILYTMGTSNPGAGAIKARVWGFTPVSAQQ